ncbi:hypothetical protein [Cochleicola gelatinilyticus]|uniref:Uncharacterized protein n=1 Tax=Cochleicola gelatinilyticus TaxID=1763537 RepID=A0A167JS46_9FLAO|nr:hypothetical protein [Cochleicola gelatinilyticus]OAB80946.1 hypothetical protein ULVI_01905 [Cochleicola gelatinilyticus]
MEYTTVYEVTNETLDIILAVPVLLAIGGFWIFYRTFQKNKNEGRKSKDYFSLYFGLTFAAIFSIVSIVRISNSINKLRETKQIFLNGNFKTVEGKIENYEPMPYTGHEDERFTINGIEFNYSDFSASYYGFHNSASHGGPIKENGQEVRIGYFTRDDGHNTILKIGLKK